MLDPTQIDVLIVLQEPFNYFYETERISFIVALCLKHNVVAMLLRPRAIPTKK